MIKIYCAPLQGYTGAAWRNAHAEVYNPGVVYFTPFIRIEKGHVRNRDLKDAISELNVNHVVVPQIIFKDSVEFLSLVQTLRANGVTRIDLNLGCPFPPQYKKGRGASMILNNQCLEEVARIMLSIPSIEFSVKMRLGLDSQHQWESVLRYINDMPLSHITVHPRIASQQYRGDVSIDEFEKLLSCSAHPVVYNGDIVSLDTYKKIIAQFPHIKGVMIGRGVLARPSLINELLEGKEWPRSRRIDALMDMHKRLLSIYEGSLCGQAQILSKIQSFWSYMDGEVDRKILKRIMKANDLNHYLQTVAMLR